MFTGLQTSRTTKTKPGKVTENVKENEKDRSGHGEARNVISTGKFIQKVFFHLNARRDQSEQSEGNECKQCTTVYIRGLQAIGSSILEQTSTPIGEAHFHIAVTLVHHAVQRKQTPPDIYRE